jgi:hypothetical protein
LGILGYGAPPGAAPDGVLDEQEMIRVLQQAGVVTAGDPRAIFSAEWNRVNMEALDTDKNNDTRDANNVRQVQLGASEIYAALQKADRRLHPAQAERKFNQELNDQLASFNQGGWWNLRGSDGNRIFNSNNPNDHSISLDELRNALRASGVTSLEQIDKNHDGEISNAELRDVMFRVRDEHRQAPAAAHPARPHNNGDRNR